MANGRENSVTVAMILKDLFSRPAEDVASAVSSIGDEVEETSDQMKDATSQSSRFRRGLQVLRAAGTPVVQMFKRFVSGGAQVLRTFRSIIRALTSFRALLVGVLGVFAVRGIARSFLDAVRALDELAKLSRRLGLTVKELGRLQFAAQQSGIEFTKLRQGARFALREIAKAAGGETTRASDSLEALGVDLKEINVETLTFTELLPIVADGLKDIRNAGDRLNVLGGIFGEEGSLEFQTILENGGDALRQLFEESDRFLQVNTRQAKIAENVADAIGRLRVAWLSLKFALVEEVGPAVESVLNRLAEFIADAPNRIRGISAALRDVFSDDREQQRAAQELLGALRDDVITFLKVSATEIGRVIAVAFIEALEFGLVAISPTISDILRDAIGPIISAIPGIDIEVSASGKLRELTKELEKITDLEKERTAIIAEFDEIQTRAFRSQDAFQTGELLGIGEGIRPGDSRRRDQLVQQLRVVEFQIKKLSTDRLALEREVAAQEEILADEREERSKRLADTFTENFTVTADVVTDAADVISEAGAQIEQTLDQFAALADAPAEAVEETKIQTVDLRATVDSLLESAKKLGPTVLASLSVVKDAFVETGLVLQDFEVRRLNAIGRSDEGERLRLLVQFQRERLDLEQRFGDAINQVLPSLLEAQRLELARFDAETQVSGQLENLAILERDYAAAIKLRNEEVEAGRVVSEEEEARLRQLRDTVIATATAIRASLVDLQQTEGLSDIAETALQQVESTLTRFREIGEQAGITFAAGLSQGLEDFEEQSRLTFDNAKKLVADLGNAVVSNLSTALTDAITGAQDFGTAFRDALSSILTDITAIITRLLIMRAIASSFGGVGGLLGFATGGVLGRGGIKQKFATGGFVRSESPVVPGPRLGRDSVPVLAQAGEGFIRRGAMDFYGSQGREFLSALNNRLVPKAFLRLFSKSGVSGRSLRSSGSFQEGGSVGRFGVSTSGATQPTIIANEKTMESLIAGGSNSLIRFLRENRGQY